MFDDLRPFHCKKEPESVNNTTLFIGELLLHSFCLRQRERVRQRGRQAIHRLLEIEKDWGDRQQERMKELRKAGRLTGTILHFDLQMNNPCSKRINITDIKQN